jgi:predicted permease
VGRRRAPSPPRFALRLLRLLSGDRAEYLIGDLVEEFERLAARRPLGARIWFLRQTAAAVLLGRRRPAAALRRPVPIAALGDLVQGWLGDLRVGFRLLVRNPAVTLPVAATLALGIGSTVTMFSITHGLLRDLPVERPEEVVAIAPVDARLGTGGGVLVPAADLEALRSVQTSFRDVAAYRRGSFQVSDVAAEGGYSRVAVEPRRYDGAEIVPWALDLLEVRPWIGRGFEPSDLAAGSPPVVLVSHRLWRERFGADPRALGRPLRVGGTVRTVVGVMPERFGFPTLQHVWVPLDLGTAALRGDADLDAFARLRPGVTLEQASAELALLAPRLPSALARSAGAPETLIAERFTERFIGSDAGPLLYAMLAVVSCVLLIACANVTNVLLARSVHRAREMALRAALGGARTRILRQLLSETLWLAGAGALGGTALAWLGVDWFQRALGHRIERFWVEFRVDGAALLFAASLTLLATVLAGLAPALQTLRADVVGALRDAAGGVSSFRMARTARLLVAVEVALSCVLVSIAALMGRGASELAARDLGFDPAAVLAGSLVLEEDDYPDGAAILELADRLRGEAAERPALGAAAIASKAPGLESASQPLALEGEVYVEPEDQPRVQVRHLDPAYFALFEVAPARALGGGDTGRVIQERDRDGAVPVAVVNVAFVERVLGGGNAVGRRVRLASEGEAGTWREIVGVVDDRGTTMEEGRPAPGLLLPLAQAPTARLVLLVRPSGGVEAAAAAMRSAVSTVDPLLPIDELATVEQRLREETLPQRTFGFMFATFGVAGLLLAGVGLYGVLAFTVSRRAREIGLSRALGADTGQVLSRVANGVLAPLAVGIAAGMGLAVLVAPLLGEFLLGADPRDPGVLLGVPALLALVASLAAALPAARASRIDPLDALRSE